MANTKSGRFSVFSATLRGVEAVPVEVEVSVYFGMPSFNIVGMPDTSIQESKERIRAAIKASGFTMPDMRIVANLAPGSIKKSGSGFDLPIAVALLAATKQIPRENLDKYLIVGELSLDGLVRDVPGILAYVQCAKRNTRNIISFNSRDASIEMDGVSQLSVYALRDFLYQKFKLIKFSRDIREEKSKLDFADISGHDIAKRALQIAACGNHGVLMMGPPGSGKSMLAERMPTILPPLNEREKMESAVIHSIAGVDSTNVLSGIRPFRSPHHSATLPGLIGGGASPKPGEVSLAHNGVLYMDELAEFNPHVLQGVRQPMETGKVTITRADGAITFPAKFSLIAATNPCPCGHYGDKDYECKCSPMQIKNYQSKIGGPVLDRIDMHLDVDRIGVDQVLNTGNGVSSQTLLEGVMEGREFRNKRRKTSDIVADCNLDDKDRIFFEEVANHHHMSGRGIMRVLSVARTIADIEQSDNVEHNHLCEALSYRLREGLNV